jgi:hypothetical protein
MVIEDNVNVNRSRRLFRFLLAIENIGIRMFLTGKWPTLPLPLKNRGRWVVTINEDRIEMAADPRNMSKGIMWLPGYERYSIVSNTA